MPLKNKDWIDDKDFETLKRLIRVILEERISIDAGYIEIGENAYRVSVLLEVYENKSIPIAIISEDLLDEIKPMRNIKYIK